MRLVALIAAIATVTCAGDNDGASPAAAPEVTLRYEGTAAIPSLTVGETFSVQMEVRHIPGKATRFDVTAVPHPLQLSHETFGRIGFFYSSLETPDEIHVRAWMAHSPPRARELVVPYLNMRAARKDVPDPWLFPLEAPIRLLFEPAPILSALSPAAGADRAWSDVTVEGTLGRALPVRRLARTVAADRVELRASLATSVLAALTHEARVYSTSGAIPDRMRLQWEFVKAGGGRMVLVTMLLKLARPPESGGLDVEELTRGFDGKAGDAVVKEDAPPGYNRALRLAKQSILDAIRAGREPAPVGRGALLAAFDGATEAPAYAAAAYAELRGKDGLGDGAFAAAVRAAEVGNPYRACEATFAYAHGLGAAEAARILTRGFNIESSSLMQTAYHAAMAARAPTSLENHAPDNDRPFEPFADLLMFEAGAADGVAELKTAVEAYASDPNYAQILIRLAALADDTDAVLEAAKSVTDWPAALPVVVHAARTVVERNMPEWKEEVAPTVKALAAAATKALPEDPRAALLDVYAHVIEDSDAAPSRLKLLDLVEKRARAAGWDGPLVRALDEALEGLPADQLKRAARIFVDAMHQTVGAAEAIASNQSHNPVIRLAAADWRNTFELLDMENLRIMPFEFHMWEAVFNAVPAAAFTTEALAAIDSGKLTPRGLRAFFAARTSGAVLVDAAALLDRATAKYPKDAVLWTLRGRFGSIDAYKKALDLDKDNVEAAVGVAETLPPADAVKLLDGVPVTDAARPFVGRIAKIYEKAGAKDAAKKWTALVGQ